MASSGNGTILHLAAKMFKDVTGAFVTHIPYRGVAPMASGIIAGEVDMGVLSLPSAQSPIKSGAMPAICVSPEARIPAAPEISTAAAELALRPGALPGNGAQLWLDIQTEYDLWQAKAKLHEVLKGMRRLDQLAIA